MSNVCKFGPEHICFRQICELNPIKEWRTRQMCWNASYSFAFAGAMFGTALVLKYFNYSAWRRAALSLSVYGLMQFAQGLNWLTVLPWSEYGKCTDGNRYATYLAYVALHLQCLFNMLSVAATPIGEKHRNYKLIIWMAGLVTLTCYIQLAIGELGWLKSTLLLPTRSSVTTYDPLVTCTYVGPYGYLLWKFKVYLSPLMPTYFAYNMFGLVILTVAGWRQRLICAIGFHGLALYAEWAFHNSGEAAAYWCHSTILLPLLFFIDFVYERWTKKTA